MLKPLVILLTSVCCLSAFGQDTRNYLEYHKQINEADSLIFILDQPEEGLLKYVELFTAFDKIFTKDLINAQTLSDHFQIQDVNFKIYLPKTQFHHASDGLIPAFSDETMSSSDSILQQQVNFNLRNRILELCAYDQATKSYSHKSYERTKLYDTIFSIIEREGYPSEFKVGLDDPLLTVRARLPYRSLETYWKALKLPKPKNYTLKEEPEIIGFEAISLIMIHNACAYDQLSNLVLENIREGNIHPGEVALLYDNQFRFRKQVLAECPNSFDMSIYFGHNSFAKPPSTVDTLKTNIARHHIGLPSIKLDAAKRAFSDSTGIRLYWGFWEAT